MGPVDFPDLLGVICKNIVSKMTYNASIVTPNLTQMTQTRHVSVCRSSMRGMIERLMSGVLRAYDQLLTDASSLNQLRSLQLLFDLKFITNILTASHDDSEVDADTLI